MNPPISLLLVHGDGSRVLRVCLSRWIAYATLGLGGAIVTVMVGLAGRYVVLTQQSGQMAGLRQRVADQHALLASFQTRIAAIRRELGDWKVVHARMSGAFGPEAGADEKKSGIGGTTADIPVATSIALRPQDELELLATGVAEEGPRLRALEHVVSRAGKIMSRLPLRWPIRGSVNSGFGPRRSPWSGAPERHEGIDIGSPSGTPVAAPAAGTVVTADVHGDYGKHVMIDHGNGVRSLYGHLKEIEVKVGQQVEKGQVVGLVGSTGRSTGPHLHYELLVQGSPVDPRGFLWE
ncbi:MAG: M23 family metallopeptidase [Candidatus Binatia bacterium]